MITVMYTNDSNLFWSQIFYLTAQIHKLHVFKYFCKIK